jgi:surfactin synthase thioesterase subunit
MSISEAAAAPSHSSSSSRAPVAEGPLKVEILAQPCVTPPPPWLIFLSPAGQEDALFRAIAEALGSAFPVALIQPSFATYGRDLYATERLGADIHDAIRRAAGPVTFVIGGFCFGALLALEVARQQAGSGCVGLMMIEAPMPGHPHFLPTTPARLKAYLRSFRAHVFGPAHYSPRVLLLECIRLPLYHLLLRTRPLLRPLMRFAWVRFAADFARKLPFQRVPQIRVPVLSVLAERSSDDPRLEQYRLDWKIKAAAGFEQHSVPGRHLQVFARSNVDLIWRWISTWAASLPETPRARRSVASIPNSAQTLEPRRAE